MHALALVAVLALAADTEAVQKPQQSPQQKKSVQKPPSTKSPRLAEHPTLLKMLFKNNLLRKTVGLRAHRIHPQLTKAAQDHAEYMARTGDFNHYGGNGDPDGRAQRYGYKGGALENIAMGYGDIESCFEGWHYSRGHWASIVSDTPVAGFGFAISTEGTPYWVGMYGYQAKGGIAGSEKVEMEDEAESTEEEASEDDGTYYRNTRRWRSRRRR